MSGRKANSKKIGRSGKNAEIRFPEELKVIKEVTDDESFKNASLARR